LEGERGAAKLGIGGGGEGGGVHASDAAEESAVKGFCGCTVFGGARHKGPDFGSIGENGGDERVKEAAHEGGCGDAEFAAAGVEGVEGALASGVEVGGGSGDATCVVEGDAKIAVGIGDSDGGAAKVPSGSVGWGGSAGGGWAGWVENHHFCFCKVNIELGGEAERV
jgi:hypothetical protein